MKTRGLATMLRNRANRASIYSTAAYWDGKALEFEDNAVSMWPNRALNRHYHREQLDFALRALGDVRGKWILDVGCGSGRISRHLAELGAQVRGIDFAPKVIDIARRQSPPDNPTYRVQSIFTLDDVAEYDIVLSWGSLTVACKDPRALLDALRRMRRALKEGGSLVVLEPIHRGFLHRVLNLDLRDFIAVMRDAGFQVRSVAQLHFWPARLALAFVEWPVPITVAGYRAGQWVMRHLLSDRAGGDYRGIYATSRAAAPEGSDSTSHRGEPSRTA